TCRRQGAYAPSAKGHVSSRAPYVISIWHATADRCSRRPAGSSGGCRPARGRPVQQAAGARGPEVPNAGERSCPPEAHGWVGKRARGRAPGLGLILGRGGGVRHGATLGPGLLTLGLPRIVGGLRLVSPVTGELREAKVVTAVDDHSRYCVIATVTGRAAGRAVCLALAGALARFGVPAEIITGN